MQEEVLVFWRVGSGNGKDPLEWMAVIRKCFFVNFEAGRLGLVGFWLPVVGFLASAVPESLDAPSQGNGLRD